MNNFLREGPSISLKERAYVNNALDEKSWYEKPYKFLEEFETDFAKYTERRYCLMTPNCTSAILMLLTALGIEKGDEVIVPDLTWVATASPIVQLGATPIFCDVDYKTWCLTAKKVKRLITRKTKAVIAVDLYGNMPDMTELELLCHKKDIHLIEDSAEALGSTQHVAGRYDKAGSFGVGSVFSFHRTKTICCGEGGALVLDDKELYEKCYRLRNHGRDHTYSYFPDELGYKLLPSNITAALALAQLHRIDELLKIKREQYDFYRGELYNLPCTLNQDDEDMRSGCWVTSCVFEQELPQTFFVECEKSGLSVRRFFYPLSSMPAFNCNTAFYKKNNHNTYALYRRGINLPAAYILTKKDMKEACDIIRSAYDKTVRTFQGEL